MKWHEGRPRLKLTGYRSAEEVETVFASAMVDVAGVVEVAGNAVFVAADDPNWPADTGDFEWLCSVIQQTLASIGITGIVLTYVPAPNAGRAEPGPAPDRR